jgi:cell division protein FtsQ
MTDFLYTTQEEIESRRKQLRQQRRFKILRGMWQTLAIGGIAGSAIWLITLPFWVIRGPQQIQVQGNELLTTQTIQSLLPIAYPQSLLEVKPQSIAQALQAQAPITDVEVSRHLFPPGLTIQVQERRPVAIAYPPAGLNGSPGNQTERSAAFDPNQSVGLLDETGLWIPIESYVDLEQFLELPDLRVIGIRQQYRSQWVELYQAVSRSPVQIDEIDWREPTNLILKTELGEVHLGPYSSKIHQQLEVLDQMRQLPENVDPEQIDYLDLRNPLSPLIELMRSTQPSTYSTQPIM